MILFYFYYLKSVRKFLVNLLAKGVSKQSINKKDFENLLIDAFSSETQIKIGVLIKDSREKIFSYEKIIASLEDKLLVSIQQIRNEFK